MRRFSCWVHASLGCVLLLGGCAGSEHREDRGHDAAVRSTSTLDASTGDAAGVIEDAGTSHHSGSSGPDEGDGGTGPSDASEMADAASRDAGQNDASVVDGGVNDASAFMADGGGADTLEECCSQQGCATTESTRACVSLPSEYGTCLVAGVAGTCMSTAFCSGAYRSTPGFCPGPAGIQCCTLETAAPADAGPAGPVCSNQVMPHPNAGLSPQVHHARCAAGATLVGSDLCVDVYEAFVRERLPDGGLAEWSPFHNPGSRPMVAVSAAGAIPQGYINADQAQAACEGAGRRLCSSSEWLRTCRGPGNNTYPYGNARQPDTCNDARARHPAVELFPNDPNPFARIQDACINQLPASLEPAGARAGCATPEGVMDLMGNLHEWVSDADGTFRGGFYVDTYRNGNGCLYATTAHNRLHWDYSTGFRCCSAALP